MLNFEKFSNELKNNTPLTIGYKTKSFLMKLISYILFFNKDFMTKYVTTIGSTVYFTDEENVKTHPIESITVLAHEFVHINDNKKLSILYDIGYLFPQILSLLSFGAFFNIWFLLFLVCLLPLPAPFRMMLELRGYKMTLYSMYIYYKHLNLPIEKIDENLSKNIDIIDGTYFKGPAYYFMWPFGIKSKLKQFTSDMYQNKINEDIYKVVKEAFEKSKVVTL